VKLGRDEKEKPVSSDIAARQESIELEALGFARPPAGVIAGLKDSKAARVTNAENRRILRISGTVEVKTESMQRFEVSPADDSGIAVVRYSMEEEFAGGLVGKGIAAHIGLFRPDGTNTFTGAERITGTLDDREGTFTITDAGFYDVNNIVHGRWTVVAGSGTRDLTGLRGSGEFTVATFDGVPRSIYLIDFWFQEDDDAEEMILPNPESARLI
jgi:hypothetical protein